MRPGTSLLEALAGRFIAAKEGLAERMVERIRAEVAEFADFDGPELWVSMLDSCRANLEEGLGRIARDRALPAAIPGDARDLARLTARMDLPLAALLRAYRVGHAFMWEEWFAAIEREPVDPGARRATVAAASRYLFDYVDRLSTFVTDEYTAERDRFMRSREQRRTQLVRDVLDGADPDPARALRELDYDLRLEHLACVVAGADPEAAVRELGRALEAPHQLVVSLAGDTAWAWLGRTRPFELPERITAPAGATVSVGDPAAGVEGFRRSHREARDAHRVAIRAGRGEGQGAASAGSRAAVPGSRASTVRSERQGAAGAGATGVVRYDEVALEALVAGDEERLRAFVTRELRGLDGADARSRRLRETLRAYFAAAQNASAAAALLGVHEHTVSYRLRTVEERLGRPVTARRAELETALRLLDVAEP